ncbi:DNA mismatch repair endonuclease MutL [Cellulosilyticum ruminicola]|uniref:DNA mismatch repair endonuclease MutL n=1 Tax=Cellulosilyticum ruminicola TaxID=425254 RepID=UPI0006CFE50D|nr:DNA mismatch repair endonuclease MutL [Cellulosilyticum ruminicola]
MGTIQILDTHTINKIAAGEVVERPSSVIKELVENSIDAKASSITVEIKNGGIDFIRVTDNGLGISKDQVEIAFLRHATSKITSAEDLQHVLSLGFRGEALASIAAVSNVELMTKVAEDLTGKRIEIAGGKITSSDEIACPNGTTFIMRHLFFNVPARREFLSSSGAEGARISDYMYKLALAHPEISFKYIQNGKTVFTTSGDHDLQHAVLNIYGKEYAKNTLKCFYETSGIECVGLLGNPSLNRSNRNYEHFFINGRYIKSTLLQKAVEDAYKPIVMVGKFPFVVLHLNISPEEVDVNVHPTKLQVRFKDSDLIYNTVYKAITKQLESAYLVPHVAPHEKAVTPKPEIETYTVDTFFAPRKEENAATAQSLLAGEMPIVKEGPTHNIERIFGKSESEVKPSFEIHSASEDLEKVSLSQPLSMSSRDRIEETFNGAGDLNGNTEALSSDETKGQVIANAEDLIKKELSNKVETTNTVQPFQERESNGVNEQTQIAHRHIHAVAASYMAPPVTPIAKSEGAAIGVKDYKIIGQLFKTYWLIQYHEKVFIIDQHAAHEKVMYEQFMRKFRSNEVATQLLLVPETFNITVVEKNLLEENSELFEKLGFVFEFLGENAIVIREVPFLLNEPLSLDVFKEILDTLTHEKPKDIADVKAEAIIRMSCRSAVKANDKLTSLECEKLIESLLALDNPFTCPHGRPTIVALTQTDIEKMFKRI